MLIANPIYDTVFKYLMENLDIAKGVISTIIGEEIDHLDFKAQENIFKVESYWFSYHLDFIARIRQAGGGGYKDVLIELQKTNTPLDLMRFRRYLGDQYRREEGVILKDGASSKEILPIVTIYFLGFYLSHTLPGVIKVNRQYIDALSGGTIDERNEFIECLTHDSYVIQIPGLQLDMKNRLEYVLSIFKQENFIREDHHLKDYSYQVDDELIRKILKQLEKAAADSELLRQLDLEEMAVREYEKAIGPFEAKLQAKERLLEEKDKAIEEKEKYIQELLKKLETQGK